jgi:hypothetical protein
MKGATVILARVLEYGYFPKALFPIFHTLVTFVCFLLTTFFTDDKVVLGFGAVFFADRFQRFGETYCPHLQGVSS